MVEDPLFDHLFAELVPIDAESEVVLLDPVALASLTKTRNRLCPSLLVAYDLLETEKFVRAQDHEMQGLNRFSDHSCGLLFRKPDSPSINFLQVELGSECFTRTQGPRESLFRHFEL